MFDTFTKKLQTVFLILLVTMLSAVFVLEFGGPQSQGCAAGGGTYAAKVDGTVITDGDFRAAYTLGSFNRYPLEVQRSMQLKEIVLTGLVERALLAREARKLGFSVTEDDVMRELVENGTAYLSLSVEAPPELPRGRLTLPVRDLDGRFDKDAAKNIIQYHLRRTVGEFAEAQVEELLAQRMRDTIAAGVTVSPEEIWAEFVREKERASLEYLRFSPSFYRDRLGIGPADVERFLGENGEKVNEEYEANRHRYTGLEKQVRARHVLIKAEADADEETRAAARKRAEAVLARARAGANFAELARTESEDPGSAKKGGDLGWNARGRMVEAFDEAQFALPEGGISEVVESQFGFHVIKVEGVREGDVPEEEAKREIAEGLLRQEEAEARARKAADAALAKLRGGTEIETIDEELRKAELESEEDPLAPRLRTTGSFGRGENPIPGPFDASPLVEAAFSMSTAEPLPEAPLKLGQDYFVFRLVDRTEARKEDFTGELRDRLTAQLLEARREEAIRLYVERLRTQAEKEGSVRVNRSVLVYGGAGDETS